MLSKALFTRYRIYFHNWFMTQSDVEISHVHTILDSIHFSAHEYAPLGIVLHLPLSGVLGNLVPLQRTKFLSIRQKTTFNLYNQIESMKNMLVEICELRLWLYHGTSFAKKEVREWALSKMKKEILTWTEIEVELLLECTKAYSSSCIFQGTSSSLFFRIKR